MLEIKTWSCLYPCGWISDIVEQIATAEGPVHCDAVDKRGACEGYVQLLKNTKRSAVGLGSSCLWEERWSLRCSFLNWEAGMCPEVVQNESAS